MPIATRLPPSDLLLLSMSEAARELGITRDTLRTWVRGHSDFPKPVTINGRPYLRAVEVAEWIERQRVAGGPDNAA